MIIFINIYTKQRILLLDILQWQISANGLHHHGAGASLTAAGVACLPLAHAARGALGAARWAAACN